MLKKKIKEIAKDSKFIYPDVLRAHDYLATTVEELLPSQLIEFLEDADAEGATIDEAIEAHKMFSSLRSVKTVDELQKVNEAFIESETINDGEHTLTIPGKFYKDDIEEATKKEIKTFDKEAKIKERISREELQENQRLALNDSLNQNDRLKYGYNKIAWKKIQKAHEKMNLYFRKNIPELVTQLLAVGEDWESEAGAIVFDAFNQTYKTWARKNIIPGYPEGKDPTATRERLLEMFTNKVREIFTQK